MVKYSTDTFEEITRTSVGEGPHVSLARQNDLLYVPCQGSSVVVVLNRNSMTVVGNIDVPGAHGAGMTQNGKTFYTTNLPGGGTGGLVALSTRTNSVIGSVDTPPGAPIPGPHNVALTRSAKKLYLTHSGPTANSVTVYTMKGNNRLPVFSTAVEVGLIRSELTSYPDRSSRGSRGLIQ